MKFTRVLKTALLLTTTLWCMAWIGSAKAATEIGDDEYIIFYHHDVLGSPLVVTDHNGNTLWHEQSDPYGKSRDRVMPTGKEFLNDHAGSRTGYTGHLKDSGSDLVYMKARYYDPAIGRFYSNDPVGFTTSNPMMFNRYAYASNNPYKYIDPDGRTIAFASEEAEVVLTIYFAKNAVVSPDFAAVIETLENDKWTHTFSLGEKGDIAIAKDNTGPKEFLEMEKAIRNGTPLEGGPTLTIVDPTRDYHVMVGDKIVTLTGEQTLAHESAHTLDRAKGVDLSPNSPNGNWPAYEDRGMKLEDQIREGFGEGGNRHGVYR